ncbi:MAG: hypothetical protein GX102_04685 [Porphyromonadaceae bacterium]|nr:hypothetical protein [Porphyromonadaceae bacterium]
MSKERKTDMINNKVMPYTVFISKTIDGEFTDGVRIDSYRVNNVSIPDCIVTEDAVKGEMYYGLG